MSKFGWFYPPGAANDPYAPYNQDDGDVCPQCGEYCEDCECELGEDDYDPEESDG